MELSGPGVQYIADNQLYNSIITAHAILMSAPSSVTKDMLHNAVSNKNSRLKCYQAGEAKLHGETQTVKLIVKGSYVENLGSIGHDPELRCGTLKIMKLKRIVHHNRISITPRFRIDVLLPSILSLVSMLFYEGNGTSHRENKKYAVSLLQMILVRNFGIAYGQRTPLPNNISSNRHGLLKSGDGVTVVRRNFGRVTARFLRVGTFTSKAGDRSIATRGSDIKKLHTQLLPVNIKSISNLKNLIAAYETIKSNPGNMTQGLEPTTLDGISKDYLLKVQEKLRSGTYKFKAARRIQIPKPGKTEKRPLTIASPREKVVQKAIQLVMEPIYESKFLEFSHGFRPGKGTRTAIQYLEAKFQSVHYIIEADFSKAFDSIPHDKLINIIKQDIVCEKTIELIRSGLKAGYAEFGELHSQGEIGTPQGSILSPLLCNIYLHQLDIFMKELIGEYSIGENRKINKEYMRLTNKAKYWRKKGYDIQKPSEYRELRKQLMNTPSKVRDESYTRVHYVRYADDFIIGIEGSAKVAKEVLDKVQVFVEDELELKFNPDKTGITKYSEKPVRFLGYSLMAPHLRGTTKPIEHIEANGSTISRRKKIRVRINLDLEKTLKRLIAKGLVRKRTSHSDHQKLNYRGKFMGRLVNLDHADILRYYNWVIRGISNYYDFVNNRKALLWIVWLLTESCALTLAIKFKLKTLSKTFKEFGPKLSYREGAGEQEKIISILGPKDIQEGNLAERSDPSPTLASLHKVWNAKFTGSNLNRACIICGVDKEVEMHHVRKIKDLKSKNKLDFFTRQMLAINRKQIPLCKFHHIGLHNNTWSAHERQTYVDATSGRNRSNDNRKGLSKRPRNKKRLNATTNK